MAARSSTIRIGTAGWNVPRKYIEAAPVEGTHLQRYSQVFSCVEINSSFYRPHQFKTWERWAAVTPADFRFSTKAPKTITHVAKLRNCGEALAGFFAQVTGLGGKLGPVLFQLPPKQIFDDGVAREFFAILRELYAGSVALEPRNATWFTPDAERLLRDYEIARVAADPPQGSVLAAKPSGYTGLRYYRLHGSPRAAAATRSMAASLNTSRTAPSMQIPTASPAKRPSTSTPSAARSAVPSLSRTSTTVTPKPSSSLTTKATAAPPPRSSNSSSHPSLIAPAI